MVRPLKADRGSIALTTIRVSPKVRQLLHDLKLKHGFATTDQVLRYYLPSNVADNRPIFHSAREIYNLTKRQPDITRDMLQHPEVDKLIKSVSKEVYRRSQTPTSTQRPTQLRQSKSKADLAHK
jgi:hypothetical protein